MLLPHNIKQFAMTTSIARYLEALNFKVACCKLMLVELEELFLQLEQVVAEHFLEAGCLS